MPEPMDFGNGPQLEGRTRLIASITAQISDSLMAAGTVALALIFIFGAFIFRNPQQDSDRIIGIVLMLGGVLVFMSCLAAFVWTRRYGPSLGALTPEERGLEAGVIKLQ